MGTSSSLRVRMSLSAYPFSQVVRGVRWKSQCDVLGVLRYKPLKDTEHLDQMEKAVDLFIIYEGYSGKVIFNVLLLYK